MIQLTQNLAYLAIAHPNRGIDPAADYTIGQLQQIAENAEISLQNLLFYNLKASALPWQNLKFIFLDVDGVMTEGGMFYTDDGDEFKRFDTKDGMAIKEAMKHGIEFGIISSGVNEKIIRHRADMFGIKHLYVGAEPKLAIAQKWLQLLDLDWDACAYIGDDINDLHMFDKVGIKACPADAVDRIKEKADFILTSKGGHGCIREFVRYLPDLNTVL